MHGAWGEKEKIIKIILFLSFEPTWGAPLVVVLPLAWRGSLGGYFFQVLVMIFKVVGGRCDGGRCNLGFLPGAGAKRTVLCYLFIHF